MLNKLKKVCKVRELICRLSEIKGELSEKEYEKFLNCDVIVSTNNIEVVGTEFVGIYTSPLVREDDNCLLKTTLYNIGYTKIEKGIE